MRVHHASGNGVSSVFTRAARKRSDFEIDEIEHDVERGDVEIPLDDCAVTARLAREHARRTARPAQAHA